MYPTVLVHSTTVSYTHTGTQVLIPHSEAQYFQLNLEVGRTKQGLGTWVVANGYLPIAELQVKNQDRRNHSKVDKPVLMSNSIDQNFSRAARKNTDI
jgi:hypothetical protein